MNPCSCSRVIPEAYPWRPNTTLMVSVSGKPVDRTHTVRIPDGASSIERFLDKASIEAHAGAIPPTKGAAIRAGSGVWKRITPDFLRIMDLAAALAVMKCDLMYVDTGRKKRSVGSSTS